MSASMRILAMGAAASANPTLVRYEAGTDPRTLGWSTPRADATTCATYIDAAGVVQTVAANVPLYAHYIGGVAHWLMQPSRANRCTWPRDLTQTGWTLSGCTAAKNQQGADGVAASASSLTATAPNATALFGDTLASSARYQTAFVRRLSGSGTVQMTTDGGATWTTVAVTASWARVSIPTQTLANPSFGFKIVTSGDSIAVDYVQNETGTFPTTPIPCAGSVLTRAADLPRVTYGYPPMAQAWYVQFVESGAILTDTAGILRLSSGPNPRAQIYQLLAGYGSTFNNGAGKASDSNLAAAPALGDGVELRLSLTASGVLRLGQSINGAAEVLAAAGAAAPLPAAWGDQQLFLGSLASATYAGCIAVRKLIGMRGLPTLADLRAA